MNPNLLTTIKSNYLKINSMKMTLLNMKIKKVMFQRMKKILITITIINTL